MKKQFVVIGSVLFLTAFSGDVVSAQDAGTNQISAVTNITHLPKVIVTGRQDSLLGIADSANQGTTGAAQLADRPILRSGEILETVPGVIITQHAGGGKANQYFLRGFNLDHGTDFAVFLDDMPLNLPSHAHGEGYSDMNTVIPEFVQRVDYEKGPYYADVGNYRFGRRGASGFLQNAAAGFCHAGRRHVWLRTRLCSASRKNLARATSFTAARRITTTARG